MKTVLLIITTFVLSAAFADSNSQYERTSKLNIIPKVTQQVPRVPKVNGPLSLVRNTSRPQSVYCRGIADYNTYGEIERLPAKTEETACREAGFKEPLTQEEINAIRAQESRSNVMNWIQTEVIPEGDYCDLNLTAEQRELIKSIDSIKGKLSCQKYASLNSQSAQYKNQKTLPELSVNNQLEACSCLAKESAPLKLNESFVAKYNEQVKSFIKKEYIANLYAARLYQYSLTGGVFAEKDIAFCTELTNNKSLQEKANSKERKASYISQLISPIGNKEATELYSVGKTEKKTPPVISKAAFDKFVQDWSLMTHPKSILNQDKNSDEIINDAMTTLLKMHTEQDFKVKTTHLTEMANATKKEKPEEKDESFAEQTIYLEKLLTAKFDQSEKPLLNQIVDSLKEDKTLKPEVAFANAFKNLTSSYMNSQCASNALIIGALLDDDYSSINFDPKLVRFLAKKMPDQKGELEKHHCAILQRVLETDPENFLYQVCEYDGEKLPPPSCPAIGDFYRARYVEKGNRVTDANGSATPASKKTLAGVLDDNSLAEVISNQVKTVRAEHSTTFSSFVNKASRNKGKFSGGNLLDVKMSDYDQESRTSFTTSNRDFSRKDSVSEIGQPKIEQIASRPMQEQLTTNSMMQGFQGAVAPSLPNQVTSPVVTFENKAATPPAPVSAPSPEVTPTLKKKNSETSLDESEEEDFDVVKTKKKKKKKIVQEDEEESEPVASPSRIETPSMNNSSFAFNNRSNPSVVAAPSPGPTPMKSVSSIPEESVRHYVEARRFEKDIVYPKESFDGRSSDGVVDSSPPETGVMLTAFRTGKISGKDVTRITIGDEIKDVKSFEQTNTYHGPVVIVEDKAKNERYICRAFVTDTKDGVDRLLPLEAQAPGKDELGGYKCTTDKEATQLKAPIAQPEKTEAKKAIAGNERLYKAFVLDKIIKQTQEKSEVIKKTKTQ